MVIFLAMRISLAMVILAIVPYTIELYSTLIRSKGVGLCSIVGRISTLLIGFVGLNSLEWLDGNGFYMIITVLAFISFLAVTLMPYDTLGRPLDH